MLPIGGMLYGFGPGGGSELQVVHENDARDRTLGIGAHFTAHTTSGGAAYIGGVVGERRWLFGDDPNQTRGYFALRLSLIKGYRPSDLRHANAVAPAVALGMTVPLAETVDLDLAAGGMIVIGSVDSGTAGYPGSFIDLFLGIRAGVAFTVF